MPKIDTASRYALYVMALIGLILMPTDWLKVAYLHVGSIVLSFFTNDRIRFYILLGMFHSAIHHIWPFLDRNGYNYLEEEFYDVFCHLMMIFFCFQLIRENYKKYPRKHKKLINYLTYFFLFGSVLNCISVFVMDDVPGSIRFNFFTYTTFFQAVSTGYWIGTMLWFHDLENPRFFYHWITWIFIMCCNWLIYKLNEFMMGLSMTYRYVEGVFMVCTWVTAICSNY